MSLRDVLAQAVIAGIVVAAYVSADDLLTPVEAREIERSMFSMTFSSKSAQNSRVVLKRTKTSPHNYVFGSMEGHCIEPTTDACPYKHFEFAAFYDITRKDSAFLITAVAYGYQGYIKAENADNFVHIRGAILQPSPKNQFIRDIKVVFDGFVKKLYNSATKITNAEISWSSGGATAVEAEFKTAAARSSMTQVERSDVQYEPAITPLLTPAEKLELLPKLAITPATLGLQGKLQPGSSRISVQRTRTSPISYMLYTIVSKCPVPLQDACPYVKFQFAATYDVMTEAGKGVTVTAVDYSFIAYKIKPDEYDFKRISGTAERKTPEGVFIWDIKENIDEHIKKLYSVTKIINQDKAWHNGGAEAVEAEFAKAKKANKSPVTKLDWSDVFSA